MSQPCCEDVGIMELWGERRCRGLRANGGAVGEDMPSFRERWEAAAEGKHFPLYIAPANPLANRGFGSDELPYVQMDSDSYFRNSRTVTFKIELAKCSGKWSCRNSRERKPRHRRPPWISRMAPKSPLQRTAVDVRPARRAGAALRAVKWK